MGNMKQLLIFTLVIQVSFCEIVNQLVIATGYNEEGSLADAEIVQVSDGLQTCTNPIPDYPLYIRGSSGGLVDDKLVICGGGYFLIYSGECYQYDSVAKEWTEVCKII